MKKRYSSLLALTLSLGLAVAGPALAQVCNVTVSSILPNGQAVLKADCGAVTMKTIDWRKDGTSIAGTASLPAPTAADLFFTPLLTGGTHSYTAVGTDSGDSPVPAGKAAVVTLAPPVLTVAASSGGTVTSTPAGINCLNGTGSCFASFAPGTTVTLTAVADSTSSFSGWGADCSGTSVCTVAMITAHTVSANFGPTSTGVPPVIVNGTCGSANGSTPISAAPSGAAACATGTLANVSLGGVFPNTVTWSCNGSNGGTSASCSAPIVSVPTAGACGSANGTSVSSPPSGAAACSAGSQANLTGGTAGPWTWSCTGLNGGNSASCSATVASGPPPVQGSCAAGETVVAGDLAWTDSTFHTVQLWPIPPVTGSGDSGRSISFVADAVNFPRGVQMGGVDEHQPTEPKDYVVSACPHNFNPVGGNANCMKQGAGSVMGPLYLRFGPAQPDTQFYDCPLTPGQTYYINFRDYFTPRGQVFSQFVIYNRTD